MAIRHGDSLTAVYELKLLNWYTHSVSLRFRNRPPPSAQQVKQSLRDYTSEAQTLGCPSAPENAIVVFDEDDRPQPRLDRDLQRGYTVSVGRVRDDESGIFDIKFVALSHNSKLSPGLFDMFMYCFADVRFLASRDRSCWFLYHKCRGCCTERVSMSQSPISKLLDKSSNNPTSCSSSISLNINPGAEWSPGWNILRW